MMKLGRDEMDFQHMVHFGVAVEEISIKSEFDYDCHSKRKWILPTLLSVRRT